MKNPTSYDAIIVGAGHNGLVASCYLAMAGLRVLILEKNEAIGGATLSKKLFPGVDARVSVYSYLISLLPKKILSDLGIHLDIRRRAIASYTPLNKDGRNTGLLISNDAEDLTRNSFYEFTGNDREYKGFVELQAKLGLFARKVWPTLLSPLQSKRALRDQFKTAVESKVWEYLVERPLSRLIEDHLSDDTVRGMVFTDAKIGVSTFPEDPSLLQNRTFIYHTIGQGTGEWSVPVGGMGNLVTALKEKAQGLGVKIMTSCEVFRVDPGKPLHTVVYRHGDREFEVDSRFILLNTPSNVANHCLPGLCEEAQVEGSVFKINMILKKLPALRDPRVTPRDAFTGTAHFYEGYEGMKSSYRNAQVGIPTHPIPGEVYCHSLTDPTILSQELQQKGYQTLTLFGLDVPYRWFTDHNEASKQKVTTKFLRSIQDFIEDDFTDCLASDANGNLCIDVKSPLDLEKSLGLPLGNIFHGNLTWPFAENESEVGTWGVETHHENVLICGSSAKRGGGVSGIPGHHAAMKVLGLTGVQ